MISFSTSEGVKSLIDLPLTTQVSADRLDKGVKSLIDLPLTTQVSMYVMGDVVTF